MKISQTLFFFVCLTSISNLVSISLSSRFVDRFSLRRIDRFPQLIIASFSAENSHVLSLRWSYQGLNNNELQKMINGNRKTNGYKLAVWNCGRGLLYGDSATDKFQDIKLYIKNNSPHVLA